MYEFGRLEGRRLRGGRQFLERRRREFSSCEV